MKWKVGIQGKTETETKINQTYCQVLKKKKTQITCQFKKCCNKNVQDHYWLTSWFWITGMWSRTILDQAQREVWRKL